MPLGRVTGFCPARGRFPASSSTGSDNGCPHECPVSQTAAVFCVAALEFGWIRRMGRVMEQKFEVHARSHAGSRPCGLVSSQKSSVSHRKLVVRDVNQPVPDANQPVPNASQPVPDGNQPVFIATDCFRMKTRSKRPPTCWIPVRNSHFSVLYRRNRRLRAHRDQQHAAPPSKNGIHDAETTRTHRKT
jgi:hypothetical protein